MSRIAVLLIGGTAEILNKDQVAKPSGAARRARMTRWGCRSNQSYHKAKRGGLTAVSGWNDYFSKQAVETHHLFPAIPIK